MATRDIYETGFDEDVQPDSSANQCPECNGHVTTNVKEPVCEDCDLVIEAHRLDHGPRWRASDAAERERTGALLTAARHDRGLSTEIGRGTDANGTEHSGQTCRRLVRMRREQPRGRWRSTADQNVARGFGEARRLASALDLAETRRDQACQLCRSAQHEDLRRGRSIAAIAAASVSGACRCNGWSQLLDDIVAVATVGESRITRPICVDCVIRMEPDPDERDHVACDGCGLIVDTPAASPALHAAFQRDRGSRPAHPIPGRTRASGRPVPAVRTLSPGGARVVLDARPRDATRRDTRGVTPTLFTDSL